jgi:hypothetical protein
MEYPNIEYILTFGKDEDGTMGLFILRKADLIQSEDAKGQLILPSQNTEELLNGHNLDIQQNCIRDVYTNKIYSWNDIHIGIEQESIYLVTNSTIQKKLWKLPFSLFNYLNIQFCYLFSIAIVKNELVIQQIKYRNTINNSNRILWTKTIQSPDINLDIMSLYRNVSNVNITIPSNETDLNTINQKEYVELLNQVYFNYSIHKIYLKDVQLIKKDNYILLITYTLHKQGHVMGYIQIDENDQIDTLLTGQS